MDERQLTRFGDEMKESPPDVALDEAALRHEEEIKQKQERRLREKGLQ